MKVQALIATIFSRLAAVKKHKLVLMSVLGFILPFLNAYAKNEPLLTAENINTALISSGLVGGAYAAHGDKRSSHSNSTEVKTTLPGDPSSIE